MTTMRDGSTGKRAAVLGSRSHAIRRLRVFQAMREGEAAGAAPRAAIVQEDDVPSGAADGLGEIGIVFHAGQAVQQDDGRVRPRAARQIDDGVDVHAMARQREGHEAGGMILVRRRIGDHRSGKRIGERGRGAESQRHQQHKNGAHVPHPSTTAPVGGATHLIVGAESATSRVCDVTRI